ncbi:MAG TPA: hypothetical protein VK179_10820 [Bacteroidales bacterium]|nr:hypothetical protein [Bacteroidales bacterium]
MKKTFFYMAVFFMVLELTYLNSRSLIYLIEDDDWAGKVFSIIGAICFSMFTVLAMRSSNKKWIAIVFPIFDIFWVLNGLNLRVYDVMLNNPIAFALRIQFGLYTGLVTYVLGTIDITSDKLNRDNNMELMKSKLAKNESEINDINNMVLMKQGQADSYQSKVNEMESEISKKLTVIEKMQSKLSEVESELNNYKDRFFKYEKGRIRKKKEANRTPEEKQILEGPAQ